MAEATSPLAHHFEDLEQQNATLGFGMWLFLVSEVMFFGGLFTAYLVYRGRDPEAWQHASHELDVTLGTFNTGVLIGSSLTMALAVRAAQLGQRKRIERMLMATLAFGTVFLGVKAVEYAGKFSHHLVPGPDFALRGTEQAGSELFFGLYFAMTGMHALHMLIGMLVMSIILVRARRGRYTPENYMGVEVMGLYWHFVDLVWIFLFPLLYLIGRHA